MIGNDVGKQFDRSRLGEVFLNPYSWITMLLIFMHQSVVALSAVFLTRAIEDFQSGRAYAHSLLLYFISMIFPYLPGCLSFVALKMWVMRSHNTYINPQVNFLRGQGNIFRNRQMRTR